MKKIIRKASNRAINHKINKAINKKSISTFISIILLISLSIAIATLIIEWYSNYMKERSSEIGVQTLQELRCGISVDFFIPYENGIRQMCYNSSDNHIKFKITNGAKVELDGIIIKLKNSTYTKLITINDTLYFPIPRAGTRYFDIDINTSAEWIDSIELIPIIKINSQYVICTDNTLEVYGLRSC